MTNFLNFVILLFKDNVKNEFISPEKVIEYVAIFAVKIFKSMIIVVLGLLLSKILRKSLKRIASSKLTKRKRATFQTVSDSVVTYIMYFIIAYFVIDVFIENFDIGSLMTLAGLSSVAIGFGAQSLIKDLITGVFILTEDQYAVGDIITVNGLSGTVESIGIRITSIRSANGDVHIIPNGEISVVTNMTKSFNRAIIDVNIAYEENPDKITDILNDELKDAVERIEGLTAVPHVLGIIEFGEYSMKIRITAECEIATKWPCERELRLIIIKRLQEEGINIPYPKHTILSNEKETSNKEKIKDSE